jgi:hypothetical protein
MSSADLVRLQRERARLISEMDLVAEEFDALIMPTTKIVAPLLSESTTPEGFAAKTPALAGETFQTLLRDGLLKTLLHRSNASRESLGIKKWECFPSAIFLPSVAKLPPALPCSFLADSIFHLSIGAD